MVINISTHDSVKTINAFDLIIYVEEDFQFLLIRNKCKPMRIDLNDKKKMRISTHR